VHEIARLSAVLSKESTSDALCEILARASSMILSLTAGVRRCQVVTSSQSASSSRHISCASTAGKA